MRHNQSVMIQLDVGRFADSQYLFRVRTLGSAKPHVWACCNDVCEFIDRSEHILLYLSMSAQLLLLAPSSPFFLVRSYFYECVKSKLQTLFTDALGAFKTITEPNAMQNKKFTQKFKWS